MQKRTITAQIKGTRTAQKLINDLYFDEIEDIDLEGIAFLNNGFIEYKPLKGAEGQIVMNGKNAIITIDSGISSIQKQRFVLAHELGHLLMHKQTKHNFFNCDINAFLDWNSNRLEETEANYFAANLLMPKALFLRYCKKDSKFSMNTIYDISETFKTSITATLIRFVDIGTYPAALIFIKNGIIKWTKFSKDFPLKYVPPRTRPLTGTVARDIIDGDDMPDYPETIEAMGWFGNCSEIEQYQHRKFREQCFCIKRYDIVISLIWSF